MLSVISWHCIKPIFLMSSPLSLGNSSCGTFSSSAFVYVPFLPFCSICAHVLCWFPLSSVLDGTSSFREGGMGRGGKDGLRETEASIWVYCLSLSLHISYFFCCRSTAQCLTSQWAVWSHQSCFWGLRPRACWFLTLPLPSLPLAATWGQEVAHQCGFSFSSTFLLTCSIQLGLLEVTSTPLEVCLCLSTLGQECLGKALNWAYFVLMKLAATQDWGCSCKLSVSSLVLIDFTKLGTFQILWLEL